MADEPTKNVDEIVEATIEKKLTEAEAKKQAEAEKQRKDEEIQAQLKALEAEKADLLKEKEEAVDIAKEAVERVQKLNEDVAHKSNPHFETAQKQRDEEDPLNKLGLKDLAALKYKK